MSVSTFFSALFSPIFSNCSIASINFPTPSTNAYISLPILLNSFTIASICSMKPSDNSIMGAIKSSSAPSKTNLRLPSIFCFIPTKLHPTFLCTHRWQPGPRAFQRQASLACMHHSQGGVMCPPSGFDFIFFSSLINH
jgi:hypothetical protein